MINKMSSNNHDYQPESIKSTLGKGKRKRQIDNTYDNLCNELKDNTRKDGEHLSMEKLVILTHQFDTTKRENVVSIPIMEIDMIKMRIAKIIKDDMHSIITQI